MIVGRYQVGIDEILPFGACPDRILLNSSSIETVSIFGGVGLVYIKIVRTASYKKSMKKTSGKNNQAMHFSGEARRGEYQDENS